MFLQTPLLSSVERMEFEREVFRDGLESLDASRLAQGEKGRCATSAFHMVRSSEKLSLWKQNGWRELRFASSFA